MPCEMASDTPMRETASTVRVAWRNAGPLAILAVAAALAVICVRGQADAEPSQTGAALDATGAPDGVLQLVEAAPAADEEAPFCGAAAAVPPMSTAEQSIGISGYWKDLCEEVAPPVAARNENSTGRSACWERMKQESCFGEGGSLSWRRGQENLARRSLMPFPEIMPIRPLRRADLCEHASLGQAAPADNGEAEQAKAWLDANVAVYVLALRNSNADPNGGRANDSLTTQSIGFELVPGVNLSLEGSYRKATREGLVPPGFSPSRAQSAARSQYQGMSGIAGSMSYTASHLQAMARAASAGDERPLALIVEDDVVLADDFAVKLQRLLATEAPCDWVAISLQSACVYGECVAPHLTRVRPDGHDPEDRCHHGTSFGFYAVLYRKATLPPLRRRLARRVWDEDRPHCLDVDVALASIADEVAYYAVPRVQVPGFVVSGGNGSSQVKDADNAKAHVVEHKMEAGHTSHADGDEGGSAEDSLVYFSVSTTTKLPPSTSTTTTTTEAPASPWWQFWR